MGLLSSLRVILGDVQVALGGEGTSAAKVDIAPGYREPMPRAPSAERREQLRHDIEVTLQDLEELEDFYRGKEHIAAQMIPPNPHLYFDVSPSETRIVTGPPLALPAAFPPLPVASTANTVTTTNASSSPAPTRRHASGLRALAALAVPSEFPASGAVVSSTASVPRANLTDLVMEYAALASRADLFASSSHSLQEAS